MRSSRDSTFLYSLRMGCGCVWWVAGITALGWWFGGKAWGICMLKATVLISVVVICLYCVVAPFYKRRLRDVEESRLLCKGSKACDICNGSGWVSQDMYNEATCPLCNGSGWEDAPRVGDSLVRGAPGE